MLQEPRPLGTGRQVRASENPGLAHRAGLSLPATLRALALFFLEGRVTRHVVLDCWPHVGGAPLSPPEFRQEHVRRVVAGGGGSAGCVGLPGASHAKGQRLGDAFPMAFLTALPRWASREANQGRSWARG